MELGEISEPLHQRVYRLSDIWTWYLNCMYDSYSKKIENVICSDKYHDMALMHTVMYTVIIRILRNLRCDLTLDWIHRKFLKLNFLRKIRPYVA